MREFTAIYDKKEYKCVAMLGAHDKGKSVIVGVTSESMEIGNVVMYLEITNPIHLLIFSKPNNEFITKGIDIFLKKQYLKALLENEKLTIQIPMQLNMV